METEPNYTFWIITTVVAVLIAIVGFFIAYFFRRTMSSTDKLNESVARLEVSITGLNGVIISNKGDLDSLRSEYCKDQDINQKRLNEHSKRLDNHGERIVKLEEKTKSA